MCTCYTLRARVVDEEMNCVGIDDQLREQKRIDEVITRQLKQEWNKRKWEKILLILGDSSSGKTTLIKQLKNVFGRGFSKDARKKYVDVIHQNVEVAIKSLLQAMTKLSIKCHNPVNEETRKQFTHMYTAADFSAMEISRSDYLTISQLWQDSSVRSQRRDFQLPVSTSYFLDNLDRIQNDDYIPTVEDVLRAHEPTPGVDEHSVAIGSITYKMVDVGRRCLETQRKWIHFFNGCAVSAVLFMVDISEYDQLVVSSKATTGTVNSLENSRALFEKLSHYQYENFKNSVFILLFNKEDIFKDKIAYSHLADHFPAYTGPKQDPEKAKNFISDLFIDSIPDKHNHVTVHFISAVVSNSAREVCKAVKHGVTHIYEYNSLRID